MEKVHNGRAKKFSQSTWLGLAILLLTSVASEAVSQIDEASEVGLEFPFEGSLLVSEKSV